MTLVPNFLIARLIAGGEKYCKQCDFVNKVFVAVKRKVVEGLL